VYRLYMTSFVFCFVHTLRLARMSFNNICRFKKKKTIQYEKYKNLEDYFHKCTMFYILPYRILKADANKIKVVTDLFDL